MKKILQILMFIVVTAGVAQNNNINKWNDLANQDPSLQPEYGNIKKTKEQIESDQEFVNKLLEEYKGDRKKAGQKMIELGF